MDEKRNNRVVERKLKDALKSDRARIQVGRISHFGLLEMSRQRIRASVLESTTQVCSHCGGTGHVRSQSSVALHVLRGIEEYLLKNTTHDITVRTTPDIALYLLNHKRQTIIDYEARFGVAIIIDADGSVGAQHFAIDRGEAVENPVKIETLFNFAAIPEDDDDDVVIEVDEEEDEELEDKPVASERPAARAESEGDGRKRKRRRRRRGRNGNAEQQASDDAVSEQAGDDEDGDDDGDDADNAAAAEAVDGRAEGDDAQRRKRRRRGKRGGRRSREEGAEQDAAGETEDNNAADTDESDAGATAVEVIEAVAEEAVALPAMAAVETAASVTEDVKPKRARRSRKASPVEEPAVESEAVLDVVAAAAEPEAAEAVADLAAPVEEEAKPARANRESNISSSEPTVKSTRSDAAESDGKPKKAGWWQRRGFF
jgi:ribonuclease E